MCSINIGPGWNISQLGYSLISENNTITDKNTLLKNALNADLKEIGSPVLNKESNKNRISELVLQIQKIRNVSAPKANEASNAAPRMLKLTLTDGETFVQAIEISNIPFISRERTPPGSKVLLQNVICRNGFLCLNQNNIKLLGGNVPHLFEKWELAKSVQHHSRNVASADGPPAWVNFGFKVSNFGDELKASDNGKSKEVVKENVEFENLRKDAIAEATTGAVRKVFGASAKLVTTAPRIDNTRTRHENGKMQNKYKKEMKAPKESIPQKPSDKVSLFDFLENKLPISGASEELKVPKESVPPKPSDKVSLFDFLEDKLNNSGTSGDIKSNQYEEDKRTHYNGQNHSYNKNVNAKKDYGNKDRKNNSEHRYNYEHDNSRQFNAPKQYSFHLDNETSKRPFKNRDHNNISKGYDNTKLPKEYEMNNSSNRYNSRSSPVKKSSSSRYQSDSTRNLYDNDNQFNRKNNPYDANFQKSNQMCRRNEEEKMHDSWHYRAPNLSNQGQATNINNQSQTPSLNNQGQAPNVNNPGHVPYVNSQGQVPNLNSQVPNLSSQGLHKSAGNIDNLAEHVANMSISGEFASRSLRQHLNLQSKKPNPPRHNAETSKNNNISTFNVGDDCLAKYWEDNKYYPSRITASTETTYVVQFKGYGNIEEVLKSDCIPSDQERGDKKKHHKGSLEFRRNPKKFVSS